MTEADITQWYLRSLNDQLNQQRKPSISIKTLNESPEYTVYKNQLAEMIGKGKAAHPSGVQATIAAELNKDTINTDLVEHANTMYKCLTILADGIAAVDNRQAGYKPFTVSGALQNLGYGAAGAVAGTVAAVPAAAIGITQGTLGSAAKALAGTADWTADTLTGRKLGALDTLNRNGLQGVNLTNALTQSRNAAKFAYEGVTQKWDPKRTWLQRTKRLMGFKEGGYTRRLSNTGTRSRGRAQRARRGGNAAR
jgi:hypothetical protein